MISKLLAGAIVLLPFTTNLNASNAQSWQDWVEKNPTYRTTTPANHAPSAQPTPVIPKARSHSSSPTPESNPNSSTSSSSISGGRSPEYFSTHNPLFEQQFLQGCQRNPNLPMSYCQCTLKEVQNSYTFNEVVKIAEFMQKNQEIPQEIMTVAMKCLPG